MNVSPFDKTRSLLKMGERSNTYLNHVSRLLWRLESLERTNKKLWSPSAVEVESTSTSDESHSVD